MSNKPKKVLLIGWDAADWKVIMPLIEQGKMPALAKLMNEGVFGKIKTLDPPLSPMLWTSIATGYRADKHGITGFVEPLLDNSGLRPVTSTSRKKKAIWNLLQHEGLKSNVVAWWPSNPAEPIDGIMVSNFYQVANKPYGQEWDMPEGTIHPKSMIDTLKEFRVHPGELTGAHLLPFMPKLREQNMKTEKRAAQIAKILANAASVHAVSTYLQRETEWDFMAVYHDAIDHFCHSCMKFYPPQREGIPENLYEKYKDVIEGGYIFHDMMLEATLSMVNDETTVILVSDHGFHSDHLRPKYLIKEPAAPAQEHSPFGIICIKGPGIKKGEEIFGASVLDITPTILNIYGFPVGENMEGKILYQAFEKPKQAEIIPDWENVKGECGMHHADLLEDPWSAQEAMQQLVELGYIEAPGDDIARKIEEVKNESNYYIARNLLDAEKFDDAIEILENLFYENEEIRYGQRLAFALLATKRYKKCKKLIDTLKIILEKKEKASALLSEEDKVKNKKGFIRDIELPNYIDYVEGLFYMHTNKQKKALTLLRNVEKKATNSLEVNSQIGNVCLIRQLWKDAQEAFEKVISIDNSNAFAYHGLGVSFLRRDNVEEALEAFLTSVEYNYFNPKAHYHIGESLMKIKNYEAAEQAFNLAISMSPGMMKAHKWLAEIYKNHIINIEKEIEHQNFIENNIKGEIIIVSGLPRSGTSMMMQIMDKGGYPILSDGLRKADTNNPKGYYEFEPVKKMMIDKSWLPQADGKVVKIIAQLLPFLPSNFNYKIIFMKREMSEVLKSQQILLGKEKDVKSKAFPTGLNEAFQKQLKKVETWINSQPNVQMLEVNYIDVIENSENEIDNIIGFIGKNGDKQEMIQVVDKSLYRNRK